MTSWKRWGSDRLNDFVRPGDIVSPTGKATGVLRGGPDVYDNNGWRLLGNDIALVVAIVDVACPIDEFNIRWLFIIHGFRAGWCAATSVQVLSLE